MRSLSLVAVHGRLIAVSSLVAEHGEHGPRLVGLVTPRQVGSFQTRNQTRICCTGRQFPATGRQRSPVNVYSPQHISLSLSW